MRKIIFSGCLTFLLTVVLTLGAVTAAGIYYVGGYFSDMAFKRGTAEDPKAPPAVFRTVFLSNGGRINPASRPRNMREAAVWTMRSFDGLSLKATHFAPHTESNRWVILVHGYGMSQAYTWNYAEEYLRAGYHVLTPDMRASGESEGVYLTMGALESRDLADWAARIGKEDKEAQIALHGVSMGAATVLLAAAKELPPQVVAVVEDAGYTSLYRLFEFEMGRLFSLPAFPILDMADIMGQQRAGFSFAEVQPIEAVKKSRLPVLFIHGTGDLLIPAAMEKELYRACAAEKAELIIPKAVHAAAWQDARYFPTVLRFLDKYLKE